MLEVCSGVTNEREKDGMSGMLRSEGPGATGAMLRAKCSSVCLRLEPSGSVVVSYRSKELWPTGIGLFSVGGSAPPFIDEGDGFTSERERVHILPSLVAHAYRALLPTPVGTR